MIRAKAVIVTFCMFGLCIASPAAQSHRSQIRHRVANRSDPGVDVGTVKQATALFSAPNADSPLLTRLNLGDQTVLVSRIRTNGWLNTIALTSGRQGWVKADRLEICYTQHPNPSVSLVGGNTGGELPPILTIHNRTDHAVFLHIERNPEVSIRPGNAQIVTISAGLWNFNASSPGIIPLFGNHAFVKGDHYDWDFYIRHHVQATSNPIRVVDSGQREELQRRQAALDIKEAAVKVQQRLIDDERAALKAQEDKAEADLDDLKTKQTVLDHTDQAAVDSFNQQVDAANAELDTCKQAEADFNSKIAAYNALLDSCRVERAQLENFAANIDSSK